MFGLSLNMTQQDSLSCKMRVTKYHGFNLNSAELQVLTNVAGYEEHPENKLQMLLLLLFDSFLYCFLKIVFI